MGDLMTEHDGRRCARCREHKPRDQFNRDSYERDGLRIYCRPCDRAISAERYAKKRTELCANSRARYWRNQALKARENKPSDQF